MPIRVLLADDHQVVRDGVRMILEAQGDITVIASADNGRDAVKLARQTRPDVALLDLTMPELNGVQAAQRICKDAPNTRVVILSMHATAEHIHRALAAGALGYVLKESAGREVVEAVRAAYDKRRFVSARVTSLVLEDYGRLRRKHSDQSPLERLSGREHEVLQMVVDGKSSKEIALAMGLSPKTVETYRSRLMAKLGVHGVPALVKFAVATGLTPEA